MAHAKPPGLTLRGAVWHIDKDIFGTRICESTGTSELKEAVMILARTMEELRSSHFFGARTPRTFREAATRFLEENQHKRSLERDARALTALDPYVGAFQVQRVHSGTLQTYIQDKLKAGVSLGTLNRDLAIWKYRSRSSRRPYSSSPPPTSRMVWSTTSSSTRWRSPSSRPVAVSILSLCSLWKIRMSSGILNEDE
jgi:hypothetical protein